MADEMDLVELWVLRKLYLEQAAGALVVSAHLLDEVEFFVLLDLEQFV